MAKKWDEILVEKALFITAISSIAIIVLIVAFIFQQGAPALQQVGILNFIFGMDWDPTNGFYGVFPMIIGTLGITALALLMGVPLSILCSLFLAEVAPDKMRRILTPTIQALAGIPSVIYGFFGLIVLVPIMRVYFGGSGFSMLAASILLTIMILPTITSISEDAFRSIPVEYKEASLALGATQWQTIRKVIFPAALPGVITAIILGMGRAIGETMAVIMVTGNVAQIPGSIFDPVRALTSNIALEMGYATGLHYNALFATGIVLFGMIIILLLIANYIHYKKKVTIGGGYL
ncbi:MAG: phosphate ABC transporter permease subunit PstC [Methanobacterium paludis]|uniref:Phosphate transport system permease protein n=1 Tax=Methanobacterium paludis (strain DSM 25820 / JCM 18151 / SWAN1) TaxID=868131 RepID=F6D6A5_METPW|nr:phosphate ABC transporter permease subunit PstC [Methanobacterium paludis]AEG18926.1 phosphate ABC transporter, inner membrane subunit PstC [Methanobacterium paludis]MCE7697699.1 phosphate ABC transporter permease subunit PstC [Methanobacterium paludis]